jgi:hypothetical protein
VVDWAQSHFMAGQFFAGGVRFCAARVPFYFQELGVTGRGALRIWTGLFAAGSGIPLAIAAPVWGSLADRYGRKPMSLRASRERRGSGRHGPGPFSRNPPLPRAARRVPGTITA